MFATERGVVVCTYPARQHADELVVLFRENGIVVAVVPSDRHDGEWDVMVRGSDAARAKRLIDALLTSD
jgi:hypothetical protein